MGWLCLDMVDRCLLLLSTDSFLLSSRCSGELSAESDSLLSAPSSVDSTVFSTDWYSFAACSYLAVKTRRTHRKNN